MKYEIGKKVVTPLGDGVVVGYNDTYDMYLVDLNDEFTNQQFKEYHLKPYKTPHERLLEMGFEMVLDEEHFTIFEHQELDYTIRVDKLWKGIGIHHYNDDPHYRYIYLELSRILTEYLEWLEEEK